MCLLSIINETMLQRVSSLNDQWDYVTICLFSQWSRRLWYNVSLLSMIKETVTMCLFSQWSRRLWYNLSLLSMIKETVIQCVPSLNDQGDCDTMCLFSQWSRRLLQCVSSLNDQGDFHHILFLLLTHSFVLTLTTFYTGDGRLLFSHTARVHRTPLLQVYGYFHVSILSYCLYFAW